MSRRRNKQSRKYKAKNEFRYNNSPTASGHPNYVFGETSTKYKALGLTHSPKENERYIPLSQNPNPLDKEKSNLKLKVITPKKTYMGEPMCDWSFSKEDMSKVRLLIKKYKRSTNRGSKKHKKRS